MLFSGLSQPWNHNDFQKRYKHVNHTCPEGYIGIMRFGLSLINYRDSRINLFQGLKDQLSGLLASNQQMNTDMGLYRARVDAFYSAVSTLNNLVSDKISGLLVSSDCRVVGDYFRFTNNVFCSNSLAHISTLGICAAVLLVVMAGGIITASVFSVRYSRI